MAARLRWASGPIWGRVPRMGQPAGPGRSRWWLRHAKPPGMSQKLRERARRERRRKLGRAKGKGEITERVRVREARMRRFFIFFFCLF